MRYAHPSASNMMDKRSDVKLRRRKMKITPTGSFWLQASFEYAPVEIRSLPMFFGGLRAGGGF